MVWENPDLEGDSPHLVLDNPDPDVLAVLRDEQRNSQKNNREDIRTPTLTVTTYSMSTIQTSRSSIGETRMAIFVLVLGSKVPFRSSYHMSEKELGVLREILDHNRKKAFIGQFEPRGGSTSDYTSQVDTAPLTTLTRSTTANRWEQLPRLVPQVRAFRHDRLMWEQANDTQACASTGAKLTGDDLLEDNEPQEQLVARHLGGEISYSSNSGYQHHSR